MALEILGSRLLAPVFGTSLFVWGALIGVVLAAMSTGYAMGGWLADRRSPGIVVTILLLGAGVWTLLLAGAGQPAVFTVSQWTADPRLGPCLAASVLLAVPAFCLSGVLPALLRLAIADMGHLGRHTGGMIAVSTIGSLVGTWGTSFFLLTWMGSLKLVGVLGVILVALGLSWLLWYRRAKALVVIAILVSAWLAVWFGFHPILIEPPAIYQEDSPYQQVQVRDEKDLRFLILDNTFHAIMWQPDPIRLALPYSQMMMAALGLYPHPQQGLILGHGGGSLAKWLQNFWPKLEMDIVEMDPSVVEAAEKYFEYKPGDKHHIFVQDARVFLRHTEKQYDIIWVDVFARHQIPFHLTTEEFFKELRARLSPKGVIAVNLASSDSNLDSVRAEAVVSTMKTSFPHIETFSIPGPTWLRTKKGSVNLIFFATFKPLNMRTPDLVNTAIMLLNKGKMPHEIFAFLTSSDSPEWESGQILTDDFSPFDILLGSG